MTTKRYCVDMTELKRLMGIDSVPMSSCSIRLRGLRHADPADGEYILPGNAMLIFQIEQEEWKP